MCWNGRDGSSTCCWSILSRSKHCRAARRIAATPSASPSTCRKACCAAVFVPSKQQREWRELTRRRAHLQGDRNRVINRIRRLLETANVKLGSAISNVVGKTGTAILRAIAAGASDPERLAGNVCGRLKCSREELIASLQGCFTEHFRWELGQLMEELDFLDRQVAEYEVRIKESMADCEEIIERLCTIPTVDLITVWTLLAEIGTDMAQFPS